MRSRWFIVTRLITIQNSRQTFRFKTLNRQYRSMKTKLCLYNWISVQVFTFHTKNGRGKNGWFVDLARTINVLVASKIQMIKSYFTNIQANQ